MRHRFFVLFTSVVGPVCLLLASAHAGDMESKVKKVAEKSTLNREGTKPFHLKATLAPSFERDKDSGRTGEVEIWWVSPKEWKQELHSPGFHQIEIVNGDRDWQKNDGDFFPEWLREIAVEVISPIPPLNEVLARVRKAESRQILNQLNVDWITQTGTAETPNIRRGYIAIDPRDDTISYAGDFGWHGSFKDYRKFHNRLVAHSVSSGTPEVTATITTLEDFEAPPQFFDPKGEASDPHPLRTELIDEPSLRKNLLPMEPISWPALENGAMQGNVTTEVVVDRSGRVRELGLVMSENGAVNDAGRQAAMNMRFKPFVVNGIPVQVMSQVTIPFKTVRPAGTEAFDTARSYFEKGRKLSFPAAGSAGPYILRAEFETKHNGSLETGRYEDTWLSDTQWRREAWLGDSHYARFKSNEKGYQLEEGSQANLLRFLFRLMEPIPAIDTFQESDWRMKRDSVNGTSAIRVMTGYEAPDGKLDAEQVRGYWFDDSGLLLKTHFKGFETQRSGFQEFHGVKVAHEIRLLMNGQLAMKIRVTEVLPAGQIPAKTFEIKGHDWRRAFTDETR